MWAANLHLRLGRWLVGVRPDTDKTRARLQRLLAAYLDTSGAATRTNFSVRAPIPRLFRRPEGAAELYVAGEKVLSAGDLTPAAHRLAGHLAGVAATQALGRSSGRAEPDRGRTVVEGGRLVVHDDRAVVVVARCAGAIDVPDAGVTEVAVWNPVIDGVAGTVVLPPPLEHLDWRAARLDPPAAPPERLRLVGVVAPPAGGGSADLLGAWLAGAGGLDAWGVRLALLAAEDRVVAAPSGDVRSAAASLLDGTHR